MDELFRFLGLDVIDAAVEKFENQLTWENFMEQAKKHEILTYIPFCEKGFWGNKLKTPTLSMKNSYLYLYDTLISLGVIERELNWRSLITIARSHTVTKDISKLTPESLKKSIDECTNNDAMHIKKCYTIDYDKLSNFLTDYNKKDGVNGYDPSDKIKGYVPYGGKKKRSTKRKRNKSSRKI